MGVLRGNTDTANNNVQNAASAFAREALRHVGGSSVFIEPKKTKKLLDTDAIE